jgi:hypothetical protein
VTSQYGREGEGEPAPAHAGAPGANAPASQRHGGAAAAGGGGAARHWEQLRGGVGIALVVLERGGPRERVVVDSVCPLPVRTPAR